MAAFFEKVQRLRAMSGKELSLKLRHKTQTPILRFLTNHNLIPPLNHNLFPLLKDDSFRLSEIKKNAKRYGNEHAGNELLDYFRKREDVSFYSFQSSQENINAIIDRCSPEWKQTAVEHADEICRHRFHLFQDDVFQLPNEIDWHLDYTTGKRWPRKFSADIPYRGPDRTGDIKYPWELSRHQYFVTLGKAYYYTGDEKYTREFISQISSWIQGNPLYRGIHWISALESALRIISWTWGFYFFRSSPLLTGKFFSLFVQSLLAQLSFIEKHLTLGYYANNHLIGEAAGLFMGGIFLKGFKGSQRWLDTGKDILTAEIEKQTHSDGVNVEQAISYQRFSMDFFILFKILHEQNFGPLPNVFDERLERMFEYLMHVLQPDGQAPSYGDSDDARGMMLRSSDQNSYREFVSIGASLYGRADMKWVDKEISEEVIWLLGKNGKEAFDNILPNAPQPESRLFSEGGYCVLKERCQDPSKANYLLFDCGPLGYGTGAHGHGDALSIQLYSFGKQAIIDPGTFAYNQDPLFRNYFRSTRAHNTVSVDGKDQAEITDRMSWANIPRSKVEDFYTSEAFDMVSAGFDGYSRLSSPVSHRRTVIFSKIPAYFLLVDSLLSEGPHTYRLHFHFPPDAAVTGTQPVCAELPDRGHLLLHVEGSSEISIDQKEGDPLPMGWYSRAYGRKHRSPSLSFESVAAGPVFFYSMIFPFDQEMTPIVDFEADSRDGSTVLYVEHNGIRDTWLLNESTREKTFRDMQFYGKMCFLRQETGGSPVFACGREARRLKINGRSYFETDTPLDGVVLHPQP